MEDRSRPKFILPVKTIIFYREFEQVRHSFANYNIGCRLYAPYLT